MRCIAVLAVLVFHAFPERLPGGFVGVDVFFVISGYLITGILLTALDRDEQVLGEFYRRRIRRIFPALIVVLLSCLIAGFFLMIAQDFSRLGLHTAAGAGFVANLVFWSEASYFDLSAHAKPLLHLWSLGVEEQFYIVWPVLLILMHRMKAKLEVPILALAVASFAYAAVAVSLDPTGAFFSPLTRFWELLAGAGLVVMERKGLRSPRILAEIQPAIGLALIAYAFLSFDLQTPFPGWWALPPVIGTVLVIAAGTNSFVNRTALSLRPVVWIGLFSYPLYLWHWPLLSFGYIENFEVIPVRWVRLGLLLLSFVLAWLTWRFVETPASLRRNYSPLKLGLGMAAVLLTGLLVYGFHGLPERTANKDPRRQFMAYYQEVRRAGLDAYYRKECDFVEWGSLRGREAIGRSCTQKDLGPYVLLWGDSHAQALSYGISKALGDIPLRQIATSGCRPDTRLDKDRYPNPALKVPCDRSNRFAMETIRRNHPDLVIIAQGDDHLSQDWEGFAASLKRMGAKDVLLIGPVPQWIPSLPAVITSHHWPYQGERVLQGLEAHIFEIDKRLLAEKSRWRSLSYVSLISTLCAKSGCIAQVPGSPVGTLMAVDYGHLSPGGSLFVSRAILREELETRLQSSGWNGSDPNGR